MNTGANAGHDASGPGQRSTADHQICNYDSNKDKLLAGLKMMVADAESEMSAKLERARAAVVEKSKHATDAPHAYVKENPWKSVGVFAAAGAILGIFLRRQ